MKARLAQINIDARPEGRIIRDIDCFKYGRCDRRPVYSLERLQDELEARHIQEAIAKIGNTRGQPQTDQTKVNDGSFLAAANKASANGLNWALPALALLICAAVVAVLAGALAAVMTGLTQNPVSTMTTIAPQQCVSPVAPDQDDIQQAFEIWKERLLWDSTLTTRAQELYNDFRSYCRSAGKVCWMTKDGTTPPRFGQAMEPILKAKKATTDTSNGTIYRGVGLPGAAT
jgi:hypothetical protein